MTTRQGIIQQRINFARAQCPTFTVKHRGCEFECFILQKVLSPLPYFAFQMVMENATEEDYIKNPNDVALFGVSEEIDPEFRPFVVRHEMHEYIDGMCCSAAAIQEISHFISDFSGLSRGILAKYLKQRRKLFDDLPGFATVAKGYTPEKVREFNDSREFFHLAGKLLSSGIRVVNANS